MAEEKLWVISEGGADRMVCIVKPVDFDSEEAEATQVVTVEDVLTQERFEVPFQRLIE